MGIMINEIDKEIFERHYPLYEMWKKHQFVKNYEKDVYSNLITLYTKYVSNKHSFSHWCSSCRAELIHHLYNWYVSQNVELPVKEEVVVDVPLESATDAEFASVEQPKKRTKKNK
jgi:hypothetical protein